MIGGVLVSRQDLCRYSGAQVSGDMSPAPTDRFFILRELSS